MPRTTSISIYLFVLNGLHISNEDQTYNIPAHIDDVVVINNKSVKHKLDSIYNDIINKNNKNDDDYIIDIFDEIILEPTNEITVNEINKRELKLPNYIFYPEMYHHKYQLIMGVYNCIIEIPVNKHFSYKYKEISKLYNNSNLDDDKTRTYTYNYLFNYLIRDRSQKHIVGMYISNLNERPLVDKINPKYNIFNNIEFLGPNEINNSIEPLCFNYPYNTINDLWNGNIAQYLVGCGLSTLLYYKLISYEFAISELSKISLYGTSIWRLLEYCVVYNKINTDICVCRFPIRKGYLFIFDYLLQSKMKKPYVIFKSCKNTSPTFDDRGHTCSILKLNNKLYIVDPFFNTIERVLSVNNIKEYYPIEDHTHIDIPFKLGDKGISLKQVKELNGFVRTRPQLSHMSFGGK
jgi:hypothetical protein